MVATQRRGLIQRGSWGRHTCVHTHTQGNESHGSVSLGEGCAVKGEATKELTLSDMGLRWGTFPSAYCRSGAFWR